MPLSLTRDELTALEPCDLPGKLALFGRRWRMTAAQALEAGASIDDLLWVAGRMDRKDLCVRFALACTRRVAHLNPDPRVQAALDATQAWLDDPFDETAWAADAADAADAAAWAARTARAAREAEQDAQKALFLEIFQ